MHPAQDAGLAVALTAAVALLAVLPAAVGIQCYQCNSVKDAHCQDLKANETASRAYLRECRDPIPDHAEPFCRKIVQTILWVGERRVVRKCGFEKSARPCYHADDGDHAEVVCQCFDEACNGARGLGRLGGLGGLGQGALAAATAALLMLLAR